MLILAVAVVAVRAGSSGTLEAATGTIDVVNVGTCYTTDDEVFEVGDCVADTTGDAYDVAERDEIVEVGTVYATYAHDPLTAPDNPRGVLYNSNLIKISIADSGRDKRTPILLAAGNAPVANPGTCAEAPQGVNCLFSKPDDANSPAVEQGYLEIIQGDFEDIPLDNAGMRWQKRGRRIQRFSSSRPETVLLMGSRSSEARTPSRWKRPRLITALTNPWTSPTNHLSLSMV